jgi:ferredoxin-NADP reductase
LSAEYPANSSHRRLYYEFFVHSHILTGVLFIGLLFWHCANQLTSWHYLYATIAIWFFSLLYRTFYRTNLIRCPRGELASLIPVSDSGVKVTIPTTLRWTAGQHVFIRIPSIAPLDNHPFTVASVAAPDKDVNDLILVFKPQSGFTRRLHSLATLDPERTYAAFLDGPYGGLSRKLESFETVLLVAGGSGITPIIGHLHHLAHKIRRKEAVTRDIRIIWTVKHFYAFEWFKDEISVISRGLPRNSLLVQYFVTQETPVALPTGPVSATLQWPGTPMTPLTPIAPAQPLRGSVVIGEEEYLRMLRQMQTALSHEERRRASSSIKSKDIELQPVDVKEAGTTFLEPPRPSYPHALTTDEPTRDWKYPPPSDDVSPVSPVSEEGAFPSARRTSTRKAPPPAMRPTSKIGSMMMGDEVHLEFGRPPLRHGLRTWAEGFGRRACIYGMFGILPPGKKSLPTCYFLNMRG